MPSRDPRSLFLENAMGRWTTLLLAAVLAVGCSTNSQIGNDCSGTVCGEACCGSGEVCQSGACCKPSCEGKTCGSDGCGGSCGQCEQGWACGAQGTCECPAESDQAFCARHEVVCGVARGQDACGHEREIACDRCAPPKSCNQATATCECVAESDAEVCARLNKQCGTLTATDNCLAERLVDCGSCPTGQTCDTAANLCEPCTPEDDASFCSRHGAVCGPLTAEDSCGAARTVASCGDCAPGLECSDAGACVACTPSDDATFCAAHQAECGMVAGLDNCRLARTVSCGRCPGYDTCSVDHQCQPCVPELDRAFCADHNIQCGRLDADDNCGQPRTVVECGPCTGALQYCDDGGQCATCVPESDADLCAFYYRDCGVPTLVDRCGQRRAVHCGTCPGGLTCQPHEACGDGTAPANDTCTRPERLVFDLGGTASTTGDTSGAASDYVGSCGGSGKDLVYAFALAVPSRVTVTVTPTGSPATAQPAVYIRAGGASGCTAPADRACGYAAAAGDSVSLTDVALQLGDYRLFVDSYSGNPGPFQLTVTAAPLPAAPRNDLCTHPQALSFAGDTATASGDTTDALDDYAESCGLAPLDGHDVVYAFTLTAEASVTASVTRAAAAPSFYPALMLSSSACPGSTTTLSCATERNGVARVFKGDLAPGDYYVLVDATGGSFGPFTLRVTTGAPVYNDVCSGATAVPLVAVSGSTTDLVGTVAGDTLLASDDHTSSCSLGSSGNDLFFRFTLPAGTVKDVKLELAPTPGSNLAPSLSLRTDCPPSGAEKSCGLSFDTGVTLTQRVNRLPADTYYVVVDSEVDWRQGPFTLTITASDPPPAPFNDRCTRPAALSLSNGGYSHVESTTALATNDYAGSCAMGSHNGPDLVYVVTTVTAGTLVATVRPQPGSPDFVPAVYLQSACGSSASDVACANADWSGLASAATTSALPAGTYYVVVDGLDGSAGEFALDVFFLSGIPSDTCATAGGLVFDAHGDAYGSGDLCAMGDDADNAVDGACTYASMGKDAVYKLVLAAPKNLDVLFNSGQGNDSFVYLQTQCGHGSTQTVCHQAGNNDENHLAVKNLAAGTYYVWLDLGGWTCGYYNVRFHIEDPPPAPANDHCSAAQPIAIAPATGVGTASGSNLSAADDTRGSCDANASAAGAGGGGEVFFSFTLAAPKAVVIEVTPTTGSDLEPVIYLQGTCGASSSENGCQRVAATGTRAQLAYPRLAAGTWYLVVDAVDRNWTGPFGVTVTTTAVSLPATNDLCANATAMPAIDPITLQTSIVGDNTGAGQNDDTSSCAATIAAFSGPDLAYSFVLANPAVLTARVTRRTPAFRPAVSLRRTCALSDEVACGADSAATGLAQVTQALGAGTWYVIVDGLEGSFGVFDLEVLQAAAAPTAGDNCGNAIAMPGFQDQISTVYGDLTAPGVASDYSSSCMTYGGARDLVYSFTTTAEEIVVVTMGPGTTGGEMLMPQVYLRSACNDPASEIGCVLSWGGAATLTTSRLPAGTYYVFADAAGDWATDTFALTVTLRDPASPPPANDTCASATAVTLTNGHAQLTGDTRTAVNDYEGPGGACGLSSMPVGRLSGGDLAYAVAVPSGGTLTASVQPDPSTADYLPAVYLMSTCSGSGAALSGSLGCDFASEPMVPSAGVSATNLSAGTYYVVVDGEFGTMGLFTLDVFVRSAAIANSSCASAEPLAFTTSGSSSPGVATATVVGDTVFGGNGTVAIQKGPQDCSSTGSELYYSFTTAAVKDFAVQTTPLNFTYQPAVYLRSNCADPGSQLVCGTLDVYASRVLELSKRRLPAGAYTLVFDSGGIVQPGPFKAEVTLSDPPAAPANDACAGAEDLSPLPGSGLPALTLSGDTRGATDDYVGSCQTAVSPFDGPEVVYTFTLTASTQVTATVTPSASSPDFAPAVYIRKSCAAVGDDACQAATSAGAVVTLTASLKPGVYYLLVDGVGASAGEYDLSLATDDSAYAAGDNCMNATALDASFVAGANPGEVVATVTGDNSAAADDAIGSCSGSSAGDVVYRFTVARDSLVTIDVGPNGTTSGYIGYAYLRAACADAATELLCQRGTRTAKSQRLQLFHVQPGTYYLWVDSAAGSSTGPFTLAVSVRDMPLAPVNDACAGATALSFVAGTGQQSTATLTNQDSTYATNDSAGSCQASTGHDVVYQVTVPSGSAQKFTATVTPEASSPKLKPVVYLRTVCNQASDMAEVACGKNTRGGAANPASLTVNSLPPGTYYLVVDSYRSLAADPPGGQFTLTATLDTALAGPSNDSCPFAQAVTLSGPAPSITTLANQTTAGAGNDAAGSCSATSGPGSDVVYSFSLATASLIKVKVTPAAGSAFFPAVYLRNRCGGAAGASELACAASPDASAAEAIRAYAPAGTYFVWVDAASADAAHADGSFDLTITVESPMVTPPANDVCEGSVPSISRGVAVTGTTVNAFNDYAQLSAGCGYQGAPGGDVVYQYTPTSDGPITVTLISVSANLFPWMAAGACGDASACVGANDSGGGHGGIDSFTWPLGRAGTTYFIYVDSSRASSSGDFILTVN